jgi:hypothetical protein
MTDINDTNGRCEVSAARWSGGPTVYKVTVRGRYYERHQLANGVREYFAKVDNGNDTFARIPSRSRLLRAIIDAAIAQAFSPLR